MERRTRWIWMGGAVGVAVFGVVLAGCGGNNAADDNVAVAPPATNTVTTTHDNMAGDEFKGAATTWGKIEMARAELDKTVSVSKWKEVHEAAFKVRDLVRTLPGQSAALEDDKKKTLESHVKAVEQLAGMLDEAGDAGNAKSVHEHHMAMNDALGMIKKLYPEGAMQDPMKMPAMADDKMGGMSNDMGNMNKSGGNMSDDNMDKMPMGGNKPMSGMGDKKMPMMDDKMPMGNKPMPDKGMGNKPIPDKGNGMSGGNKKPSGGGMSGGGGMSDM